MRETETKSCPPIDQYTLDLLGNPPLRRVSAAMDKYNREHAGGGIQVEWEPHWVFVVPYLDVLHSVQEFARMSRAERRAIMRSINNSIATLFTLIKKRIASQ